MTATCRAWIFRVASGLLITASALAVNWPNVQLGSLLGAGQLAFPVYLTHAGDGSGRIFVIEQRGTLRIIQNGTLLPTPFLNITNRVLFANTIDERGCLGLAFPPAYVSKGYFYVYYYASATNETRLSRFFLTTNDVNVADADSEQIVLRVYQPQENHNGAQICFGPDGYLYVCLGDGGTELGFGWDDASGHVATGNGQSLATRLGKILRIDVESPPITNAFQIPPDNPFVANSNFLPEIWAYGVRNPYRCSFDRLTGDLWIGDVGRGAFEEVDFQPAASPGGENYGWRRFEGYTCSAQTNDPPCDVGTNGMIFPVAVYAHDFAANGKQRRAVTGGYVHRGAPFWSFLHGTYFYADYNSGEIWGIRRNGSAFDAPRLLFASGLTISGFGEDEVGNVYVMNLVNGAVRRIDEVLADADHDQLPDAYEFYYGLNSNLVADAVVDTDGDGLGNREEFVAGTDPTNAASRLQFTRLSTTAQTNQIVLQWTSSAGRRYGVRSSSNLNDGFIPLQTNLSATPPLNSYTTDTILSGRYYTIDVSTGGP